MTSTIGRIVPKAGQRKLFVKAVSYPKAKDPRSFHGIEYLIEFYTGESFTVLLTPKEGILTDDDFARYKTMWDHFGKYGGGPVGLIRSGPYKAIESASGELVGISRANGRKRASAIWNGELPEGYEQC